jgi:hypothetical protein
MDDRPEYLILLQILKKILKEENQAQKELHLAKKMIFLKLFPVFFMIKVPGLPSQFYLKTAIREAAIMKNNEPFRGRVMQISWLIKNSKGSKILEVVAISAED